MMLVDRPRYGFVRAADVIVVEPEESLEVTKVGDFVIRQVIIADSVSQHRRIDLAALHAEVPRTNTVLT